MLTLRKVAVTGGLASGKTSVCRILKELGAYVLSADEIVHQLLSSDHNLIHQVTELLGSEVCVEGKIDRSKVAAIVFHQPKLLKSLEKIIHPVVRNVINQRFNQERQNPQYPLFVVEIPLLFEACFESGFDFTVAVVANEAKCRERCLYPEDYEQRTSKQMTPREKSERADFTIENNGSLDDLYRKVKELYEHLIKLNHPLI